MAYHKIDLEIISHKFKRVKDCAKVGGIGKNDCNSSVVRGSSS